VRRRTSFGTAVSQGADRKAENLCGDFLGHSAIAAHEPAGLANGSEQCSSKLENQGWWNPLVLARSLPE
jgi:hypothetical protein